MGVAEYGVKIEEMANTTPHSHHFNPNPQPSENKNIRRRVYDALNVLMALNIIYKNKKQIHWLGIPDFSEMAKSMMASGGMELKKSTSEPNARKSDAASALHTRDVKSEPIDPDTTLTE